MMLTILGIFYATMVLAGYLVEFLFGGLGLIPAERAAKVTDTGIQWNYTTVLNIIFLVLAAALLLRFFRTGGPAMLKMMGGPPGGHEQRAHGTSAPHARDAPGGVAGHERHAPGRPTGREQPARGTPGPRANRSARPGHPGAWHRA
jgi:hypothetical protein